MVSVIKITSPTEVYFKICWEYNNKFGFGKREVVLAPEEIEMLLKKVIEFATEPIRLKK